MRTRARGWIGAGVVWLALGLVGGPLFVSLAEPAHAVEPDEVLKDAGLEARARALSAGLRCLVCQNQSIDDSAAPLARDLRLLVRERLTAGDSDKAVKDYVVDRYGAFVLLAPPFQTNTLLLWLAPFGLMAVAGGIVWRFARKGAGRPDTAGAPLDADEERRLARMMDEGRG